MLCCGTLALAASLTLAVGRRLALVILAGGGTLLDPAVFLNHARTIVVQGQLCLG